MRKSNERRRLRSRLGAIVAASGLLALAAAPASADVSEVKGSAFSLKADLALLNALPVDLGPLARVKISGPHDTIYKHVVKAKVPPILEVHALASAIEADTGHDGYVKASSRVGVVKLKLLGDLLIKLVKSECRVDKDTVFANSEVVFADGTLAVLGIDDLGVSVRPNTKVSIAGLADLILNEQIVESTQGRHNRTTKVTVNALRLRLNGLLGDGDLIISQSVCQVKGPDVARVDEVKGVGGDGDGNDGSLLGGGLISGLLDGNLLGGLL